MAQIAPQAWSVPVPGPTAHSTQPDGAFFDFGTGHPTLGNLPLTPELIEELHHPTTPGVDHYTWLNDPDRKHSKTERDFLNKTCLYAAELSLSHVPNIVLITVEPDPDGVIRRDEIDLASAPPGFQEIGGLVLIREDFLIGDKTGYSLKKHLGTIAHEEYHLYQERENLNLLPDSIPARPPFVIKLEDDADRAAVDLTGDAKSYKADLVQGTAMGRRLFEAKRPQDETYDHWVSTGDNAHRVLSERLSAIDDEASHHHRFKKPAFVPKVR